jgi:hypothetical protein
MWIRIRAVIVEDEPLAAEYLATLLDDTYQVAPLSLALPCTPPPVPRERQRRTRGILLERRRLGNA